MDIKALIIDDEINSLQAIENVLNEFCSEVIVVAKTQSPIEGIRLIGALKPDVVFLDIEMPEMTGFEMLESIPKRDFEVVFITAYDHYAVKAFKVNAIDYILKPINIKDITHAINRIVERKQLLESSDEKYSKLFDNLKDFKSPKIHISTNEGTVCLNLNEIIRFEADGRYCMAFLSNKSSMCFSKTLKELEAIVNKDSFLRIHKSHYINMEMVKKYNLSSTYQIEMIDGSIINISRRKKDAFLKFMLDIN